MVIEMLICFKNLLGDREPGNLPETLPGTKGVYKKISVRGFPTSHSSHSKTNMYSTHTRALLLQPQASAVTKSLQGRGRRRNTSTTGRGGCKDPVHMPYGGKRGYHIRCLRETQNALAATQINVWLHIPLFLQRSNTNKLTCG